MKTCIPVILFIFYSLACFAQKPAIDSSAFNKWTFVSGSQLSSNGSYALYTIEDQLPGKRILIVMSTKNNWKLELPQSAGRFTADSKYVIFKRGKDSLGILKTGGDIVRYIPFIQSYSISRSGGAKW